MIQATNVKIESDTLPERSNNGIVFIKENDQNKAYSNYSEFVLFKQIPLTIKDSTEITISLETLFKEGKNCYLVAKCLDIKENILCSDSVEIKKSFDINDNEISFHVKENSYIHFEIKCKENSVASKMDPKINVGLGKFNIKIDGIDYNLYQNYHSNSKKEEKLTQQGIEYHDSLKYEINSLFAGSRIVGLGETVHGCKELNSEALRIMKALITNDECDLVLFELPISQTLIYNDFVKNRNVEINIDSVNS